MKHSSTSTRADVAPGRLWLVGTPIGSLEDVTLRALRVLKQADVILAEDTRRTRNLCTHHGIQTPLRSFHAHSPDSRVERLVAELAQGAQYALVTDAGMPVVSDPGARLVRATSEAGVPVETVPGPSAVTAAVAVSGLRCDTFRFVGFLPRKGGRRTRLLAQIGADPGATVLFEAPSRVGKTLADLAPHLGDRPTALCRELSKRHEEVVRGTASALADRFAAGTRGEVTLVVGGLEDGTRLGSSPAGSGNDEGEQEGGVDPDELVRGWLAEGVSPRDAAQRLAERLGLSRRGAYQRVLAIREEG